MSVQEEFGDDVRIIGVPGATDSPEAVRAFVAGTNSDVLTHIPDYDRSIWEHFDNARQRTYLLVNDDGTRRVETYGNLRDSVEDLIAQ